MSADCACGQPLHPGVDRRRGRRRPGRDRRRTGRRARLASAHVGHQLGGGDQRLAGHAVGEHRRAAEPVAVDDGHLGAELGRHQGGLVAARSATDDHDTSHAAHPRSTARLRDRPWTVSPPWPSTPPTARNLDPAQMAERCPHSPLRGTGWLIGWRLTFGGEEHGWDGALATVVEDPAQQVFVALYDVTREDERHAGRLGGRRHRPLPQDPGPGADPRRRAARLGLRAGRLRGRPALGALPRACSPTPPRPAGAPDDYVAGAAPPRPAARSDSEHRRRRRQVG